MESLTIGWPQLIWIMLASIGLAVSAVKQGQPRGEHSFVWTLVGTTLAAALLYWGGFFSG